jgi:hypothetical protein
VLYKNKNAKQRANPKAKYDNENIEITAKKIKTANRK